MKAEQVYRNKMSNAQGRHFESCIEVACQIYQDSEIAKIEKTPEPFRVIKKHRDGTFAGRFTALAQPDFLGTLQGGRSICFEAKYTSKDRMRSSVLTETQMKALELHEKLGAVTGVCVGIQDKHFFIPLEVWKGMKNIYGRQYLTQEDIEQYRVKFTGAIMFLDYIHKTK